jgi:AraC-like DNA-binding protein
MHLGSDLTLADRLHLDGELLAVGSIALACDAPAFGAPKALAHHHIVLPRNAMAIVQDRRAAFVADPVMVTLHDPGVPYWREPIAGLADDSDYLALQPALAEELLAGARRFDCGQRLLDARGFAAAQALFSAARQGRLRPGLQAEEAAIEVAAAALRGLRSRPARTARVVSLTASARGARARLDAVGRAKRVLAERLDESLSLADVARAACVSPWHLTREFRARTGLTLHAYVMALRVRRALLELERWQGRLDQLAAALGYAGLPHLSRSFRQAFGVGPREWMSRQAVRAR